MRPTATPAAGRRRGPRLLAVPVAIVLLIGAVAILVVKPWNGAGQATAPGPIDPTVVTEAIDLTEQPVAGQSWPATDTRPGDQGLASHPLVTPCGVFVTIIETEGLAGSAQEANPAAEQDRILGYDIASGRQLWTIPTPRAAGLIDPHYNIVAPTYTPTCTMVLPLIGVNPATSSTTQVSLVIDLRDGQYFAIASAAQPRDCGAVDDQFVACWAALEDSGVALVDLDTQAESAPPWPANPIGVYADQGDIIVAGAVWSAQGYRDPTTGQIVFGSDTRGLSYLDDQNGDWVVYRDPGQPGGYRSGLAVRIEGRLTGDDGTCQFSLWDTVRDRAAWKSPAAVPCGQTWDDRWATAGDTLVVSSHTGTGPNYDGTVSAYDLSSGRPLWQADGWLGRTSWDIGTGNARVVGLTQTYAWIRSDPSNPARVIRLADGASVTFPHDGVVDLAAAATAYAVGLTQDGQSFVLGSFPLDPAHPDQIPPDGWFLVADVSLTFDHGWTFATGGVMYIVLQSVGGDIAVTPLIA